MPSNSTSPLPALRTLTATNRDSPFAMATVSRNASVRTSSSSLGESRRSTAKNVDFQSGMSMLVSIASQPLAQTSTR